MDFAIQTENLGRIYKIRGGKKSEPTLEDVFVHLVGQSMEEVERSGE